MKITGQDSVKTMETYTSLKVKQRQESDNFEGIFFAFNDKQFNEGMQNIGLNPDDTKSILKLGCGGFIRKDRLKAFDDLLDKHKKELKEFKKERKTLLDSLVYELKNHEYCITYDPQPALDILGLDINDIDHGLLKKAKKLALEGVNR